MASKWQDIPEELVQLRQWVCWKLEKRNGQTKPTKVPYQPNGLPASSTNPHTWSSFSSCVEAASKFSGIGFVFAQNDPYTGIDLDGCLQSESLAPWAKEIIDQLDTYIERSPSKSGLHAIAKASVGGGRRAGSIEIYDSGRYFTFTGDVFDGHYTITDQQDYVSILWDKLRKEAGTTQSLVASQPLNLKLSPNASPSAEKFAALLANSKKFKQTWEHKRQDLKDQTLSSYDLSLVSQTLQAGWSDQEIAELIIAHRRSWDSNDTKATRADYVSRTIAKARSGILSNLSDSEMVDEARLEGAETDEILSELSGILGARITRFVRVGADPVTLEVEMEDRRVKWISQGDLLTFHMAEKAWFEATGLLLRTMKSNAWKLQAKRIIDISIYEAIPETSRKEALCSLIQLYLERKPLCHDRFESEERVNAIEASMPLAMEDGRIALHLEDWLRWYGMQFGTQRINRVDMIRWLAEAGFRQERIRARWENRDVNSRRYFIGKVENPVEEAISGQS